MMTATVEREVVRRNDVTVKIDAEVARKAKIVAAYRGLSLAEYLSERLARVVDDDLRAEQAGMTFEPKPKSKGPK